MQHDEMIWQIINNQFCSFKTTIGSAKSEKRQFCRHPYSVTGLCNRTTCPLANSRYATVREEGGRVSLYIKTVERAHSPKNLWERIYLSRNYAKALAQLDEHLAYWPKALVHRNKQRLTKIHQYLIRMRKIKLRELAGRKSKLVGVNRKVEQREGRREKKALVAAKVEKNIEKELVERLARGTYGDIYNFPEVPYQKALEEAEKAEAQEESEEEMSEEEEEEEEEEGPIEYVEDLEEEEDEEDLEDMQYMGEGQWGPASDESEDEEEEEESSGMEEEEQSSDEGDRSSDSGESDDSGEEGENDDRGKKPQGKPSSSKKKRRPEPKKERGTRIEIEYEEENEGEEQMEQGEAVAGMAW